MDESLDDAVERAADRGVTMHKVLELALRGEDYADEFPAIYTPYVDAIELFLSKHTIEPIAIEQPIYSDRLGVAGTPDLLCMMDDVLTLVDYKFVSSVSKAKVRAQLTGYSEILKDHGVFVEQMIAVQFMQGNIREYPVDFGGDEWETALKAYGIKKRKYKRGRIG
jgi:predicted RecB family nuclease